MGDAWVLISCEEERRLSCVIGSGVPRLRSTSVVGRSDRWLTRGSAGVRDFFGQSRPSEQPLTTSRGSLVVKRTKYLPSPRGSSVLANSSHAKDQKVRCQALQIVRQGQVDPAHARLPSPAGLEEHEVQAPCFSRQARGRWPCRAAQALSALWALNDSRSETENFVRRVNLNETTRRRPKH